MTHAIRALLPQVPHPDGCYPSLEAALAAIDKWVERHVSNEKENPK